MVISTCSARTGYPLRIGPIRRPRVAGDSFREESDARTASPYHQESESAEHKSKAEFRFDRIPCRVLFLQQPERRVGASLSRQISPFSARGTSTTLPILLDIVFVCDYNAIKGSVAVKLWGRKT